MAITGMLASAMVFVIVAGEIDLSVGSLLGLLGGIAAVLDVTYHWPLAGTIAVVILLGIAPRHRGRLAHRLSGASRPSSSRSAACWCFAAPFSA